MVLEDEVSGEAMVNLFTTGHVGGVRRAPSIEWFDLPGLAVLMNSLLLVGDVGTFLVYARSILGGRQRFHQRCHLRFQECRTLFVLSVSQLLLALKSPVGSGSDSLLPLVASILCYFRASIYMAQHYVPPVQRSLDLC